MIAIFENSAGWNWTGPTPTDRYAPFVTWPMPGHARQHQEADRRRARSV